MSPVGALWEPCGSVLAERGTMGVMSYPKGNFAAVPPRL
jgi:hypothetical protein